MTVPWQSGSFPAEQILIGCVMNIRIALSFTETRTWVFSLLGIFEIRDQLLTMNPEFI